MGDGEGQATAAAGVRGMARGLVCGCGNHRVGDVVDVGGTVPIGWPLLPTRRVVVTVGFGGERTGVAEGVSDADVASTVDVTRVIRVRTTVDTCVMTDVDTVIDVDTEINVDTVTEVDVTTLVATAVREKVNVSVSQTTDVACGDCTGGSGGAAASHAPNAGWQPAPQ